MYVAEPSEFNLKELYEELFPLCRSITGPAYEQSLEILKKYVPFTIESFPSGSKVNDWTVPEGWSLNRATLKDSQGNIILDTHQNPLHVLNFSEPFTGKVSFEDLKEHLFFDKNNPDAIPYTTSYYKPRWGLNISYKQFQELKDDEYEVCIDTIKDTNGSLKVGICDLKGDSDKIIQISSYLCHPNMLNNELSGPLALVCLYLLLKSLPKRRYSYRFVIHPESIGSIAYLSRFAPELKEKLEYGINLTCLASPRSKDSVEDQISTISLTSALLSSSEEQDRIEYHKQFYQSFQNSYNHNFLQLPVSFKLTRQSYIDSIVYDKKMRSLGKNITAYAKGSYFEKSLNSSHYVSKAVTDMTLDDEQRVEDYLTTCAYYCRCFTLNHLPNCHVYTDPRKDGFMCSFDIDNMLRTLAQGNCARYAVREYAPNHGSDEKQYCSPKLNLKYVQATRTMYGSYNEYHTSLDNSDTFSLCSIMDSALEIFDFIRYYEIAKLKPTLLNECDPQLGPRGLYPNSNDPESRAKRNNSHGELEVMLYILSLCSSGFTTEEIAEFIDESPLRVSNIIYKLYDTKVLDFSD
ncbi:DUF4910 domain-containing protein [Anaerobiospirillum succiniciproducens]|uniref:DUF4910 domain-containing protein n=1 Tax=Anaerobiospirillum succiniciproducens TaxID=13335 RepID=UPI0004265D01|nr:DUF4910 domain-containing protein [Anaerobiospirillum succiniciproducens]